MLLADILMTVLFVAVNLKVRRSHFRHGGFKSLVCTHSERRSATTSASAAGLQLIDTTDPAACSRSATETMTKT
jgi:hypothetical protein